MLEPADRGRRENATRRDGVAGREALLTAGVAVLAVFLLLAIAILDPVTCFRDDMLTQYLGASREVWHATTEGHLALVTPRSWFGGALAGEYQHGVFSVFAVATQFAAWSFGGPLSLTAFLLVAIPLAIASAGTFRLARVEGCSVEAALFAAVAASFNGWTLRWAIPWYPSLATFAWVPWLFWALRRGGWGRPFAVAVFSYAIIAGGWPFTILLAGVGGSILALEETRRTGDRRALLLVGAGAVLGACLAAPAIAMLRAYSQASARLAETASFIREWRIPPRALPSFVAPGWEATWRRFDSTDVRQAPELWLPLSLAYAAALLPRGASEAQRSARRRAAPWLVVAGVALVLAALPSHAPFRWSFRWLPLLHLAMALTAAIAIDATQAPAPDEGARRAWLPGSLVVAFGAFGALVAAARPGPFVDSASSVVLVAGAALLLTARLRPGLGARLARLLPTAAAALGIVALMGSVPSADVTSWPLQSSFREAAPFDPARTYLGIYVAPGLGELVDLRFGDVPLMAGLSFVNGYSPLRPKFLQSLFPMETHGWIDPEVVPNIAERVALTPDLLDALGIDGLVVTPPVERMLGRLLAARGWAPFASLPSGRVWHHGAAPSPRAWLVDAEEDAHGHHPPLGGEPVRVVESDTGIQVTLPSPLSQPAILVVKRAAYPGYVARVNGAEAATTSYIGVLVGVPLAKGTAGTITIDYRPRAFVIGAAVAAVALAVLAIWLALASRQRRLTRA